ncbi:MAG TPA: alpha/beta fold hydrolase [Candidatus Methylomirabilis sp.]|nr:alpha/beta fold hydrolase [Candidatus Methylomirabilis sp.]
MRCEGVARIRRLLLPVILAALTGCATLGGGTSPDVLTELLEARTSDGVRLSGALWTPARPDWRRPALLLVHGYAGNFYEAWPPLARPLAARGFPVLALNMRDHDRTPQTSRFEDNRLDIEAGIRTLAERGADRVVLVGQSLGTNRVLFYQAETQDPRVRDVILMAPPGNLLEWNIRSSGRERALAVLAEAEQRVREGKGDEVMQVDLGPLGTALYSARHILSLRGPETRSDPFQNIARVRAPILILHGTADRLADPAVSTRLAAAATAAQSVQVHILPGLDHALPRHPSELLPILQPWLETVIP